MIAQTIESDHNAGQEVFAVVGNAAQPAWDERTDEMRALATLWDAHGTMLERAVFPRLGDASGALIEGLRSLQRQVEAMAADLARRGPEHDADGRWLADFEELKRLFDAQCQRESAELVPFIRERAAPAEIAEMTRIARALRQERAV
ncbi:MAG TPA: hemerythrin domain-containing protein [Azospirillum sp.]|nr:hemerythrin domain-containing protein [Azospirillum sp.]